MLVSPASQEEVATELRRAFDIGTPTYAIGGGTSLDFGLPAKADGVGLSLDKLKQGGARVIQCTCTCRREGYDADNEFDQKLDALAEVARSIAREQQLPLIDLRKAFIEYWEEHNPDNKAVDILTYDGNHWNETGHAYVATQMLKKFE